MNDLSAQFLDRICSFWSGLESARSDEVTYWSPEEPPIIILSAFVGHRIVEDFDEMGNEARLRIFSLIEDGMISEDEQLGTAVATGMIEAMTGRAERLGNWERIRDQMGVRSRWHADIWTNRPTE